MTRLSSRASHTCLGEGHVGIILIKSDNRMIVSASSWSSSRCFSEPEASQTLTHTHTLRQQSLTPCFIVFRHERVDSSSEWGIEKGCVVESERGYINSCSARPSRDEPLGDLIYCFPPVPLSTGQNNVYKCANIVSRPHRPLSLSIAFRLDLPFALTRRDPSAGTNCAPILQVLLVINFASALPRREKEQRANNRQRRDVRVRTHARKPQHAASLTVLPHGVLQVLDDVLVGEGQHVRPGVDHGYRGARHDVDHARVLHADHPCPHNDQIPAEGCVLSRCKLKRDDSVRFSHQK